MLFQQNSLRENFWLLFVIAIMLVFALLREVAFFPIPDMIPNPDSSWLLYVAQRVADGQSLYVDIMETNPPLIVWLHLIPVWVGKVLHLSPFLVFPFLVTVLNIGSLGLVAGIIRKNRFLSEKLIFYSILLYISFAFFLLSPAIYGQRELLFIALVLPYLVKSLGEDEYECDISARGLMIIIMAAIGFAIKPFFLLLWGMNELHLAVKRRSFRSIFSFTNWFIGLSQLTYLLVIYFYTPEYITMIIPTVLATYFTYEVLWLNIGKFIGVVIGLVFGLFWIARPHGDYRNITLRIMVWMLACAGFIVLQRKEWLNHLYPLVFMAGFAVVIILLCLHEYLRELGLEIGYRKFTALCIAVAILLGCSWVDAKFWYFIYKHPSVISKKLITEINEHAAGKYVYPLTYNLQPTFPVIALSEGVFRGSFQQLWPLMGLIIREQQEIKTNDIVKARQFFYDTLVHDFANYPPEFVWVDDNVNLEKILDYDIEPDNRDIIAVLSRDVRFAVLWQNYEKIGEIEGGPPAEEDIIEGEKIPKLERYSLYIRSKNEFMRKSNE